MQSRRKIFGQQLRPEHPGSVSPPDRRGPIVAGALVPAFRVERSAHRRYPQDLCLLASQGFQTVLALEVARRSATAAKDIRQLIARMVRENITWGEERIADELSLFGVLALEFVGTIAGKGRNLHQESCRFRLAEVFADHGATFFPKLKAAGWNPPHFARNLLNKLYL
jgi:hypothetical protein